MLINTFGIANTQTLFVTAITTVFCLWCTITVMPLAVTAHVSTTLTAFNQSRQIVGFLCLIGCISSLSAFHASLYLPKGLSIDNGRKRIQVFDLFVRIFFEIVVMLAFCICMGSPIVHVSTNVFFVDKHFPNAGGNKGLTSLIEIPHFVQLLRNLCIAISSIYIPIEDHTYNSCFSFIDYIFTIDNIQSQRWSTTVMLGLCCIR